MARVFAIPVDKKAGTTCELNTYFCRANASPTGPPKGITSVVRSDPLGMERPNCDVRSLTTPVKGTDEDVMSYRDKQSRIRFAISASFVIVWLDRVECASTPSGYGRGESVQGHFQ